MGGAIPKNLKLFSQCNALCNESKLLLKDGRVQRNGLPTEAALKVLNEKIGRYDPQFKNKFTSLTEGVE